MNIILKGFTSELTKLAITRPTVEWFPEDYTGGQSAMLHRTAEGNMFEDCITYIPKKNKLRKDGDDTLYTDNGRAEDGDAIYDKDTAQQDEDMRGATRWAEEISDKQTSYQISPRPVAYIRSK